MREIQASDAKTHFCQTLDEVERGETIIITRHGRAIARLVPEAECRHAEIDEANEASKKSRRAPERPQSKKSSQPVTKVINISTVTPSGPSM